MHTVCNCGWTQIEDSSCCLFSSRQRFTVYATLIVLELTMATRVAVNSHQPSYFNFRMLLLDMGSILPVV